MRGVPVPAGVVATPRSGPDGSAHCSRGRWDRQSPDDAPTDPADRAGAAAGRARDRLLPAPQPEPIVARELAGWRGVAQPAQPRRRLAQPVTDLAPYALGDPGEPAASRPTARQSRFL